MLQGLKRFLPGHKPANPFVPDVPIFKENMLLIQAFPKKRTVSVTYNGVTKVGYFGDNTIKKMLAGRHFKENTEQFLGAVGQLIKQLTK
jgi:hypothetical protein